MLFSDTEEAKIEALLEFIGSNLEDVVFDGPAPVGVTYLHIEQSATNCQLTAEREAIGDVEGTLVDKLLLWAAAFPVFNQAVPSKKGAKVALTFLTIYVLGREGGGVLPNRALERVKALERMLD